MINLDSLPEKGLKREKAILELGSNPENAEALMFLVNTEKGKCKNAALKALACLECQEARPLWQKLVKGKYMGESIFANACSDCVSEEIAPAILCFLGNLLNQPKGEPIDVGQMKQLRFCISIMLGKSSQKMQNIYRFIAKAENLSRFASLKQRVKEFSNDTTTFWDFNVGTLILRKANRHEMEKVFPLVMAASLIRNQDVRLMALADELYVTYGGAWLIPVFMKAILTEPKEKVYDEFVKYLSDESTAIYLFNVFGWLDYYDYPDDWRFKRDEPVGYEALVFWGNFEYGAYDTQFIVEFRIDIDDRWLFALAKDAKGKKPKVHWQSYNRRQGGVSFENYDEMLLELLPEKIENKELKELLYNYFKERSLIVKVPKSVSVYEDALCRLQR